jgi:hypothetical protein
VLVEGAMFAFLAKLLLVVRSRLMVWTPPAINGFAMSQGCVSNIRKARRVRDGSYNDRNRLGKECVRG